MAVKGLGDKSQPRRGPLGPGGSTLPLSEPPGEAVTVSPLSFKKTILDVVSTMNYLAFLRPGFLICQ